MKKQDEKNFAYIYFRMENEALPKKFFILGL